MIDAIATINIAVIVAGLFWGFLLRETGIVEVLREGEGCEGVGRPIGEEEWG